MAHHVPADQSTTITDQTADAAASPHHRVGSVVLVGGGPGDPDLLTVGGLRALREADVVLYDHLAPLSCLDECRDDAVLIDVAKFPRGHQTGQDRINELLVEHALSGANVVRFKGGDPFVFGRGSEEWLACAEQGIPVRVIPGVSSSIAGPELAGIPVTHRGITQQFTVVTGHVGPEHPASTVDWDALAHFGGTIVILMGVKPLPGISAGLIARGMDPQTPAAVVANAGLPGQAVLRGTLSSLPDQAAASGVQPPALTIIGAVTALDLPLPPA